jgi:hypothetical protein fgonA2_06654
MSTTKLTLAQKVANLNTPLTWDNIQNKPPFGTEANTILEGSKFIEGLGVNGYGGTIQDPGQKVAGKCYFDINTKSLFLCKTTNNLTSPNSDYFTSFDNKSLLNKLENYCTTTITARVSGITNFTYKGNYYLYSIILTFYKISKHMAMVTGSFVSFDNYNYGNLVPLEFRPRNTQTITFDQIRDGVKSTQLSNCTLAINPNGDIVTNYPYSPNIYHGTYIYRLS